VHNQDGKLSGRLEKFAPDDLNEGEVVLRVVFSEVNYKDALAATGKGGIMRRPDRWWMFTPGTLATLCAQCRRTDLQSSE
jgi:NADPH:quinone reductase-like Zn-dependent oxidoreductase